MGRKAVTIFIKNGVNDYGYVYFKTISVAAC